jgi:hypothetical protein
VWADSRTFWRTVHGKRGCLCCFPNSTLDQIKLLVMMKNTSHTFEWREDLELEFALSPRRLSRHMRRDTHIHTLTRNGSTRQRDNGYGTTITITAAAGDESMRRVQAEIRSRAMAETACNQSQCSASSDSRTRHRTHCAAGPDFECLCVYFACVYFPSLSSASSSFHSLL